MRAFFDGVAEYFREIFSSPLTLLQDVLDILLIAVMVYAVIRFMRDTRAAQLIKGFVILLVVQLVTKYLHLTASYYILSKILEFGILALIIIFQPELRSALERIGRKGISSFASLGEHSESDDTKAMIHSVCDAVADLSATKTGALIVIEHETKLGEIINTGIRLDATPSAELIGNVFYPKAPLHDGAMIIRNNKIYAAGCFLPLSTREVGSDLGTRHRAALGVSEISDAIVVVVSEETGIISIANGGRLNRRLTPDALSSYLTQRLVASEEKKKKDIFSGLWKGRKK